ncbi:hypothetical protein J2801_003580 [Paraburkholderia phenoliruptrix]|uniref:hypothetical protein n=1 Tax=Paraburkholderia phenoliruptrix TaxID=252970 RepID=UPI0028580E50|nr:hypothetical protein [Paraburkholderia phenoliruptrix]MDR6421292.1 hypothetical protein [Paraburkholderia phenoliruptrix]
MTYPNDQGNPAGAIPVYITSGSGSSGGVAGPSKAGVSSSNSVGTTSAPLIAAGTYKGWVTVQNTHTSQILYVSFGATATTSDFAIAPGAALSLPFGPTNALNGVGSGAGTTFAVVGY